MSDCDVCIGVGDYEPAEFYQESEPIARKEHTCCECLRVIPIGNKHLKIVGKWGGIMDTFRQCLLCREIQLVFACGESHTFTTLWQDMDDYVFERLTVRSPCFNKLSLEARAVVTEKWWEWKERHTE